MANGYAKYSGLGGSGGGGGGTPGGANTSVQFNNGGSFGGFGTWDGTTLSVPGTVSATGALVAGGNFHVFGTSIAAGDFVLQGGFSASGNLGFYGASEIAQPTGNILTALSNLNLVSSPSLPLFTSTAPGAVSASGGGTTNFLRADGTWAPPAGGGSVTSVGLSAPAAFTVSGSPVTGTGTLALTYSGTAIPVANGGTGLTANTTTPAATTFASWDANKDLSANSFNAGYTTTVTSATPVVLTVASTTTQVFTGTTVQTVTLPVATTLLAGQSYIIINLSTAVTTVNSSGANAIQAMAANTKLTLFLQNPAGGTTAAAWTWEYTTAQSSSLPVAIGGTGTNSVRTAPAASSWAGWDANSNMTASGFIPGFTTTATAAGTTALTIASKQTQVFTGTTTQTVTLPTTSVAQGQPYTIVNLSTGNVTVNSSAAGLIEVMAANTRLDLIALIATPTTAANWSGSYKSLSGAVAGVAPTIQRFLTGTSLTYTRPSSPAPLYIKVTAVGGGGGGGGSGSGGNGGSGGTTSFGSIITCTGGTGSNGSTAAQGTGGTATVTSGQLVSVNGAMGDSVSTIVNGNGGNGGVTSFGGAGAGGYVGLSGNSASANTGSGGGGAPGSAIAQGICGGGAGGFASAIITSPSSTYTYTVGAGGAAGTAGTIAAGGAGGSGIILVEEYYQ